MPSRLARAIAFGALLTLYSVTWMYLVRQEADVVVGIDTEFRPICQCLELTSVTPIGPAAQAGLTVGDRVRALVGRRFATSRFSTCAATGVPARSSGCRSSATAWCARPR